VSEADLSCERLRSPLGYRATSAERSRSVFYESAYFMACAISKSLRPRDWPGRHPKVDPARVSFGGEMCLGLYDRGSSAAGVFIVKTLPVGLLDDVVERLVSSLNPERIILFGSYAYGEPNEHSDIDLMVVVSVSNEPGYRRAQEAHKALQGLGYPKDIIVMTRREFDRKATVPGSLVSLVLRKGKALYG